MRESERERARERARERERRRGGGGNNEMAWWIQKGKERDSHSHSGKDN